VIARTFTFALLCVAPAPALAEVPEIALSWDEGGESLARRLGAELRTRGYRTRDAGEDEPAIDARARIEVRPCAEGETCAPPSIQVCIAASPCERIEEADPNVLLIRTVETLRAQLGEPTREPAPALAPAPASPSLEAHTDPWELSIAASLVLPTSGLSFGVGVALALAWAPDPWLGLELGGFLSALHPMAESDEGEASVAARIVWLGASLRIPETVLAGHHLSIGAAIGVLSADVYAFADPPFEARGGSFAALLPMLSAVFVLRVVDRFSLAIGLRAGAALPQPILFFSDREVARAGAPFVSIDLGAVADLTP
jgi:hypothetical protein